MRKYKVEKENIGNVKIGFGINMFNLAKITNHTLDLNATFKKNSLIYFSSVTDAVFVFFDQLRKPIHFQFVRIKLDENGLNYAKSVSFIN